MSKYIIITVLLMVATTAIAGDYRDINSTIASGPWWLDDAMHIGAGAAVAYAVGRLPIDDPVYRRLLQIAMPLAMGLAKEATDKHFSGSDLAGWGVGAALVLTFEW